jgi:hypothetical protein
MADGRDVRPERIPSEEFRMASSIPASERPRCSPGRGFASLDPERQREVVGVSPPIATAAPSAVTERLARAARPNWMCVLPDGDNGFEGSSSRRGR